MSSPTETQPATAPTSEAPGAAPTDRVLINAEEQYCLWPAGKAIPAGWSEVFSGSRQACLDHVETVWTDMRPKSVRE